VLLAIRAVRDKERKAAKAELDSVDLMLTDERAQRLACERDLFRLRLLLTRHGIEEPP
jgi:hypothetical protein